ncbi:TraR/DksA C4-type zinc finger protein [Pseudomonas fluorescens]|uniref:DnaK suppressor protein n=2 Tax=Pseudomonas fluorescens TaxID=294 RepID=A0A8B4I574_PSEFL|nr:TraR/DksA C4-type zinc finger protein [Pseudomonas fluorescens]MCI4605359.1 TraR/DksA C4-type zinc finger protein [Pseudomonas fluorescens]PQB00193.1 DnaK suppressor protein [Pseudomonas fluorescens]RFP96747.1 DnaK suppressor protein [Pseudomonas fluorescens]TWR48641.1 DnaK suppressor protein [Pseudomonas fluorescens]UKJ70390.1 TraR/DksA C4-type zinc finger protein [Pseudomonas fluorescens]
MSDICDDADVVIEEALNRSLSQIPRYTGISATECVDCGDVIPEGRRVAIPGVTLCAPCKALDDVRKLGVRRG